MRYPDQVGGPETKAERLQRDLAINTAYVASKRPK